QRAPVGEAHDVFRTVATDGRRALPEIEPQPVAADRVGERLAERPRLAGQDVVHPLDEVDACSERGERLRERAPDRAAAEDHDAVRNLAGGGRLAIGPDVVETVEAWYRRDDRVRAGGDHDLARRVALPIDVDRARPRDPAAA